MKLEDIEQYHRVKTSKYISMEQLGDIFYHLTRKDDNYWMKKSETDFIRTNYLDKYCKYLGEKYKSHCFGYLLDDKDINELDKLIAQYILIKD